MSKKLNWFEISLLLIPLGFLIHQIFSLRFSDTNAGGLVFVLVIMSFSSFFFSRRDYNYFVLTITAYSGVVIIGSLIMVALNQEWMILLLIWALIYTKAFTSTFTPYGEQSSIQIDEELNNQDGVEKLIATPTQRKKNVSTIKDMFIIFIFGVVVLFTYEHFSDRYEQIQKRDTKETLK